MNLIEAVRSGRPFRRVGKLSTWCHAADDGLWSADVMEQDKFNQLRLDRDDVLAEDYVCQEPNVTVTATQLKDAINRVWDCWDLYPPQAKTVAIGDLPMNRAVLVQEIARALGLAP